MRWMLIVAVLVGCNSEPSADIKVRAAELSSGFKKHADVIITKQDETLTALAAIKSQVESLTSETREATDTLKASLVKSEPQREEVIKSALEPQEPTRPDPSQSLKPVASAPAVRSSGPLKMSWNVEGNWNPTILETAKHLREDHGIIADGMSHQHMHDVHAAAHEGRQVATKSQPVRLINRGTQCPGGFCPTPRRGLFGRRR